MKFHLIRTIAQIPIPSVDITHIGIHHSLSSFGSADIIDGWHRQRGMNEVAYHYIIHNGSHYPAGVIETGRNVNIKPAAHKPRNTDSLAICVIGNFDVEFINGEDPRALAVAALVTRLMALKFIAVENVFGHKELTQARTCPGDNIGLKVMRKYIQHWYNGDNFDKIHEWYDGANFVYTGSKDQIACVQRILNQFDRIHIKLVVDGILGPKTHSSWSGVTNETTEDSKGVQAVAWSKVLQLVPRK